MQQLRPELIVEKSTFANGMKPSHRADNGHCSGVGPGRALSY